MDGAARDPGGPAVRAAVRALPRLTSRRHIDLARVCSAASSPHGGGQLAAHA
ncbi:MULTISPECIES: hypothetical protein [unclassified Streptomyces]|uniref:hypothetical protein n=1 Tax=unclassified Streptomyces TaxID=2593676 RepID=UPI00278C545E|nr:MULTISPECIES: hypothetical protein [unclassified Streptomyces]